MKMWVEDLPVVFPYSLVFTEQQAYMRQVKTALDGVGHALLEMPTGTGKTVCLLALLTAYLSHRPKFTKEMDKTLKELRKVLNRRQQDQPGSRAFLCLGLTAKHNLCVHEGVSQWRTASRVETECRSRTAQWVESDRCQYYDKHLLSAPLSRLPGQHRVLTLEDLRELGPSAGVCPYFTAREAIRDADIVVFNYLYMLDPQISPEFIKKVGMSGDCIVVFDEAHNIDDVCVEAFTLRLNNHSLSAATSNIQLLQHKINQSNETALEKYKSEIHSLLSSLRDKIPTVNEDSLTRGFVPQSIGNSKLYLKSLSLVLQFLRNKLKEQHVRYYDTVELRKEVETCTNLDPEFFTLAYRSLTHLQSSLHVSEVEELKPLRLLTLFSQLVFSHAVGFKLVFQPHPLDGNLAEPRLTLSCLDCALALRPLWRSFPCVILTSGTMSPLLLYPRILGFNPLVLKSIPIKLGRNPVCPLIVGTTPQQQPLSSQYQLRSEVRVAAAYANLLRGLIQIVPDGIICFFPSYVYMEHMLKQWSNLNFLQSLLSSKFVFMEKRDAVATQQNLKKFRTACDRGRGAVLLAIARGKVAEGVDFQNHYGRCVVMMGFPVQNSLDPVLLERIRYMVEQGQLKDRNEFFQFDTMRQCAQCLGRVMRTKNDYGLMVLADSRFTRPGKYEKLPPWIKKCLLSEHSDVSPIPTRIDFPPSTLNTSKHNNTSQCEFNQNPPCFPLVSNLQYVMRLHSACFLTLLLGINTLTTAKLTLVSYDPPTFHLTLSTVQPLPQFQLLLNSYTVLTYSITPTTPSNQFIITTPSPSASLQLFSILFNYCNQCPFQLQAVPSVSATFPAPFLAYLLIVAVLLLGYSNALGDLLIETTQIYFLVAVPFEFQSDFFYIVKSFFLIDPKSVSITAYFYAPFIILVSSIIIGLIVYRITQLTLTSSLFSFGLFATLSKIYLFSLAFNCCTVIYNLISLGNSTLQQIIFVTVSLITILILLIIKAIILRQPQNLAWRKWQTPPSNQPTACARWLLQNYSLLGSLKIVFLITLRFIAKAEFMLTVTMFLHLLLDFTLRPIPHRFLMKIVLLFRLMLLLLCHVAVVINLYIQQSPPLQQTPSTLSLLLHGKSISFLLLILLECAAAVYSIVIFTKLYYILMKRSQQDEIEPKTIQVEMTPVQQTRTDIRETLVRFVRNRRTIISRSERNIERDTDYRMKQIIE